MSTITTVQNCDNLPLPRTLNKKKCLLTLTEFRQSASSTEPMTSSFLPNRPSSSPSSWRLSVWRQPSTYCQISTTPRSSPTSWCLTGTFTTLSTAASSRSTTNSLVSAEGRQLGSEGRHPVIFVLFASFVSSPTTYLIYVNDVITIPEWLFHCNTPYFVGSYCVWIVFNAMYSYDILCHIMTFMRWLSCKNFMTDVFNTSLTELME